MRYEKHFWDYGWIVGVACWCVFDRPRGVQMHLINPIRRRVRFNLTRKIRGVEAIKAQRRNDKRRNAWPVK